MTSTAAAVTPATTTLLSVRDLDVTLLTRRGSGRVLEGVSFELERGESFGLVGESGSGKSMTALSIMRLLPQVARVTAGQIVLDARDVLSLPETRMRQLRGGDVGLIFQQARSSLNPLMRIEDQILRVATLHREKGARRGSDLAVELLGEVGLPARVARSYPHQLSGGMAQRALIAIVLAAQPRLLMADEPTTGLDVTTEAEIYDLLRKLRADLGLSLLLITHDLALVAQNCDRVAVMHAGHVVETGRVEQIFERPLHPYTRALLNSVPRLEPDADEEHALEGSAPRLDELPPHGCRFAERCPHVMPKCAEPFGMIDVEPEHRVLCRLYD
jgi:oligopeptide/dipeptide ABC transporter ATP-binding protein